MNMQIKNNFITSDENVMKHRLVIFNWCFTDFQTHPPDPNRALWLAYKGMNY